MLIGYEIRKLVGQGPEVTFIFVKELFYKIEELEKEFEHLN